MKKLFFLFICLLFAIPSQARTIIVDANGSADFNNIQAAIDDSNDGDVIEVRPGTYTGTGNRDIDFGGLAITVRSIDPNEPDIVAATIIDCNGTWADPHRGFYFHSGEDDNSTVEGLTITNGYAYNGGGIYCDNSSPLITYCNFIDGTAINWGGGICCYKSSPSISNCTFTGNSAFEGGAITTFVHCYPVIDDCFIAGNTASGSGGGINSDCLSTPTIINCTIAGNFAGTYGGGGISIFQSNPTVTNCIITGNSTASSGGGILQWYWFENGSEVTNCTISGNSANEAGGIFCSSKMIVTNSILWDNSHQQIVDQGTVSVIYSDVQGGWPGEGNFDADPALAFSGDYHLMPDSPCIDAGTNTPIGGLPTTDIEGNPRPLDGDGDGNPIADMGVYEYNPEPDGPVIAVSATSFSYVQIWQKPAPQTLLIKNCGAGTLYWQIVEDCNWLQVTPTTGVSTGQINEVTLTVNTNSLAPGHYNCIFQVLDPNAPNSPRTVHVILRVKEVLRVPSHFLTIQAAIDAADDGDVVLVANGTYTGDGNKNLDFDGKAITVCSENGPDFTIIDCENSGYGFYFRNGEKINSVVDGFTITNGYSGIVCSELFYGGSSPTITNCTISGNSAGIYCGWDSNPTITNCTITGNTAHSGGGIHCRSNSSPTITNCTITGNTAWEAGGGICCWYSSSPTITNCTITGNTAWEDGGGICCRSNSSPTITNCTITDNTAWEDGGGIACEYDSNATITNCTITGNSASEYGGGITCEYDSNATITDCTLSDNSASDDGGGIYCFRQSSLMITNSTITGNSAGKYGGGIYCWESSLTITNCTISNNIAEYGHGGGIYCASESDPTITNCIINGNSARGGGGICCSNPTITNCTISNNKSKRHGGGIYCSNSTIINCTVTGNSADFGHGGGIICSAEFAEENSIVITNCIVTGNSAKGKEWWWGGSGGGIGCFADNVRENSIVITNCIITGNSATGADESWSGGGGGIICSSNWCDSSNTVIDNCTISGNSANWRGGGGGGIHCESGYQDNSMFTITNCILWDNNASNGPEMYLKSYDGSRNSTWVSSTDIQGGQDDIYVDPNCELNWGDGNIGENPFFIEPGYWADPNDPNIIVEPNDPNALWVEGDYHLLSPSPCIDAGDNNSVPEDTHDLDGDGNTTEPLPWDLDGNPRIGDGNDDGNSVVDMGAYEFIPPVPAIVDIQPQTLNLQSKGVITAFIELPEPYSVEDIDLDSVRCQGAGAIRGTIADDILIVKFDREQLQKLMVGQEVELLLTGELADGTMFEGTDVIRVIDKGGKK